jgi:hypothetical protein
MPGASIQRPLGSRIDNPGTRFAGNKVMKTGIGVGTRLATVSSSPPMTGYRDMRRIICGTAKHASKKSAGRRCGRKLRSAEVRRAFRDAIDHGQAEMRARI